MNFPKSAFVVPMMALFLALSLARGASAQQEEPSVGNLFIDAYMKKDQAGMRELIKTRTAEFPPEVMAMVQYAMAPDTPKNEADFLFNIAGNISALYGETTGDQRLLDAVRANYQNLLDRRKAGSLPPEAVEAAKKAILELGKDQWQVRVFRLDETGALLVEIDVRESAGGAGFTPRIDLKQTQQAKEIIKENLPGVKQGKISWSSMGVGLKTAFLE